MSYICEVCVCVCGFVLTIIDSSVCFQHIFIHRCKNILYVCDKGIDFYGFGPLWLNPKINWFDMRRLLFMSCQFLWEYSLVIPFGLFIWLAK